MATHTAREHAFQLIYELELKADGLSSPDEILELYFETAKVNEKSQKYISDLVRGVHAENTTLNAEIKKYLRGWKLERISKLSLSALKLAIHEMQHNNKITPAIAISEAIKLIAKYEGEEAASFVNGVLGQYVKKSGKSE